MFVSLRWRIVIPYIVVIVLTTGGLTLYLAGAVRQARLADLEAHLLTDARLLAEQVRPYLSGAMESDAALLQRAATTWAAVSGERVTLIMSQGTVLAESSADLGQLDNHLYRAEVQQALRQDAGVAIRFSDTLQQEVMYAAVAVRDEGALRGFVRTALPFAQIQSDVRQLCRTMGSAGAVIAVLASLLAFYIAARTIRPVEQLTAVVTRVASGDLSARLLPTTHDEVGRLTRAFNAMADQLRDQMTILTEEREQLAAVLDTMADGVMITDPMGQVLLSNGAARQILQAETLPPTGTFAQAAHNHELIALWERCLETGAEQMATVETLLHRNFLQVIMTPLLTLAPPRVLIILQDLTQVRRLETVRRDFISNISHELRTPLASLALVVETLRDGALEDLPAARRFLSHMENELGVLTQMVEELLELSRIESGKMQLEARPTAIAPLVQTPLERLAPQAERKGVTLTVSLAEDLPHVYADVPRMHQVLGNLIHNAIKFTPTGGAVTVFAQVQEPGWVTVSVMDTGSGIPAADVPRIFERFYKVDRARSEGGAGLGLAIAKHIVQGHGGRIWVESTEGVGSTFSLTLRMARQKN
ncbi:MAG TPA: ATP-binding protein [Anaerolineae bacterium]|nr:ATP-binding protein [Anaerolineae bacterium]